MYFFTTFVASYAVKTYYGTAYDSRKIKCSVYRGMGRGVEGVQI